MIVKESSEMQQQLNTPEELRAIREAMDEGKNPLVATVCHAGKIRSASAAS